MGSLRKHQASISILYVICVIVVLLSSCRPESPREVIIYTSVDQVYSEPIFQKFEDQTGIKVRPVYDIEAAKTTGLVNRLIAEKNNPRADVFWNGEFAQTLLLKEKGVLQPYESPNAVDIPSQYLDRENYWAGFAGRARVLLVNTDMVSPEHYPASIYDLIEDTWPADKIGVAYPLFGTAATQAAALYATLGPDQAREYYTQLYERGVRIVDGNSVVRDMVASGQLMMGLTDTDDSCAALEKGAPVAIIFPDQDGLGTLVIPNTVAMIAGAPHPEEARALIDFLLSREVAGLLIESGWSHIPLRPIAAQSSCPLDTEVVKMNVDLESIYAQLETAKKELAGIYIR